MSENTSKICLILSLTIFNWSQLIVIIIKTSYISVVQDNCRCKIMYQSLNFKVAFNKIPVVLRKQTFCTCIFIQGTIK